MTATSFPLARNLAGASLSDWLGTAQTAAEIAVVHISRIRQESGNHPFNDLDNAEANLVQALEELRMIKRHTTITREVTR